MRRHRAKWILLFIVLAPLVIGLFGFVVMHLWNWLAAGVFGWHSITFWQALGILILARILFGKFAGPGGRGMYWRRGMMERWEQMTPEEREKFRQGMRGRCGPVVPPETEQKA